MSAVSDEEHPPLEVDSMITVIAFDPKTGTASHHMAACDGGMSQVTSVPAGQLADDAFVAVQGYELRDDMFENYCLRTETPRGRNTLARHVRTTTSSKKKTTNDDDDDDKKAVDVPLELLTRSQRPDGTLVALLAAAWIDVTPRTPTGPGLRLNQHLGSLLCQQSALLEAGRYADLLEIYKAAADLIAGADDDDDDKSHQSNMIVTKYLDACRTSTTLRTLVATTEAIVTLGPGFGDDLDVQLEFHRSGDAVPYPLIRARFVVPLQDIACLHGDGVTEVDIVRDHILEMTIYVTTSLDDATTFAREVSGYTLVDRLQALQRNLTRSGLGISFTMASSSPAKKKNNKTHSSGDTTSVMTIKARLLVDVDVMSSRSRHQINDDDSSPTVFFPTTNMSSSPRSSSSSSLSEEATSPDSKTTTSTILMIVEDQPTLSHMLTTCAKTYGGFDEVVAITSPEEVATSKYPVVKAVRTTDRVVVCFDENLYTVDDVTFDRIPMTRTRLRDTFLEIPLIRSAKDDGRLIFVAYSTDLVNDCRLHLTRRKGTATPRNLIADVRSFLATTNGHSASS